MAVGVGGLKGLQVHRKVQISQYNYKLQRQQLCTNSRPGGGWIKELIRNKSGKDEDRNLLYSIQCFLWRLFAGYVAWNSTKTRTTMSKIARCTDCVHEMMMWHTIRVIAYTFYAITRMAFHIIISQMRLFENVKIGILTYLHSFERGENANVFCKERPIPNRENPTVIFRFSLLLASLKRTHSQTLVLH